MQTKVADDRRLPCLFGIAGHAIFSPTSLLSPSLGKGLTETVEKTMRGEIPPLRGIIRNGDLSRDDAWYMVYMGHVERVRRTDYADGTDMLALKRERGRLAQNSKKIDLEN